MMAETQNLQSEKCTFLSIYITICVNNTDWVLMYYCRCSVLGISHHPIMASDSLIGDRRFCVLAIDY